MNNYGNLTFFDKLIVLKNVNLLFGLKVYLNDRIGKVRFQNLISPMIGLDFITRRFNISAFFEMDNKRPSFKEIYMDRLYIYPTLSIMQWWWLEAGLLARQTRPHVILLDTNLPGLKAKEMRTALRSDPELVATRVIAVEDALDDGRRDQRVSDGFDGCLARPFSLAATVRVIEEATDIVA